MTKNLSPQQIEELLDTLRSRFQKHKERHVNVDWNKVLNRLQKHPEKLWSLHEMERTGGEPDLIAFENQKTNEYFFYDCSAESPKGRRSLCYDEEALISRKENKPAGSAVHTAEEMGIELLSAEEYQQLQKMDEFDKKTSSWIKTPDAIRKLGGALFCDRRYDTVFVYHNGAESYYAARGFRGKLTI